jgi:hypothetical protein
MLEVLKEIVCRPWLTGKTTKAVLVRKFEKERPSLLLDEYVDDGGDYSLDLLDVLKTGYTRSGSADLCVREGKEWVYKAFSTFGLKCLAGIGNLPDTVADRSIPIRLERKFPDEPVERFRVKKVKDESLALRTRLETWAEAFIAQEYPEPKGLDDLNERAADIWEPLFIIAEASSETIASETRQASLALVRSQDAERDGVILLRDILMFFQDHEVDRAGSGDLCDYLKAKEESPWGPCFGQEFNPRKLAKMLSAFTDNGKKIRPRSIRLDDGTTPRGYHRAELEEAFSRYVPSYYHSGKSATSATSATSL